MVLLVDSLLENLGTIFFTEREHFLSFDGGWNLVLLLYLSWPAEFFSTEIKIPFDGILFE
jgi:hypothetical protein